MINPLGESDLSCANGGTNQSGATGRKKPNRVNWQGRNSFDDYPGAPTYLLKVKGVNPGDICPECNKGKLYNSEERKLLQFTGNMPVSVTRYKKQVLRCNACSNMVMNNQDIRKWDNSARSAIILQKMYGMPFYRLSRLQSLTGIPLAASTAWKQCLDTWQEVGRHIYKELLSLASQGTTFHVDDTGAKILEVIAANKGLPLKDRRACNTTTICTKTKSGQVIILYITANKHAGENFAHLLANRIIDKDYQGRDHYLKLITDASNRNKPVLTDEDKWLLTKIINANCLAHGQRKYSEIEAYYPEECKYFLTQTRAIYHNEHKCKGYNDRQRLKYHKKYSSPYIKNIYNKIEELFRKKQVEPNSSLGKAMRYWLNNKDGLTKFLKVKGISLDNNWAERMLRGIIMQRKNSLFFKTKDSAAVLSGLHSIVRTCQENGINSFSYLNWLQDNWLKVENNPKDYLPFSYVKYVSGNIEGDTNNVDKEALSRAA